MTTPTQLEMLAAWETIVQRETEAIEKRIRREARKLFCGEHVLLDAVTIELTGRFIGRTRERIEEENKRLAKNIQ